MYIKYNCTAPTHSNKIVFHLFYTINSITKHTVSYDPAAAAVTTVTIIACDAVVILRLFYKSLGCKYGNLDVICVSNQCKEPIRIRLLLENMQFDGLKMTLHFSAGLILIFNASSSSFFSLHFKWTHPQWSRSTK